MAATQALAITPAEMMAAPTVRLYVASGEAVDATVAVRALCEPGTEAMYVGVPDHNAWASPGYAATWQDIFEMDKLGAWGCRVKANPGTAFSSLAGRNLAVFFNTERGLNGALEDAVQSHQGGSGGLLRFLAPTGNSCTLSAPPGFVPTYRCDATQMQRPMLGAAEVNPEIIDYSNVLDESSFSGYPSMSGSVRQAAGVMRLYGLAASLPLYRAMQTAQGLPADDQPQNRPSISLVEARSYLQGTVVGWQWLIGAAHPRAAEQVNLCVPRPGSGMRAVLQRVAMDAPCGPSALTMARWYNGNFAQSPGELDYIGNGGGVPGLLHLVETDTAPAMDQCMGTATSVDALALGVAPIGRFPTDLTPSHWTHRFLKLDGVEPHRDAARTGRYPLVGEAHLMWSEAHVAQLPLPLQQLIRGLDQLWRDPAWLTAVGLTLNGGTMVPPSGAGSNSTLQAAAYRSGNMCQPVTLVYNEPPAAMATQVARPGTVRGTSTLQAVPAAAAPAPRLPVQPVPLPRQP